MQIIIIPTTKLRISKKSPSMSDVGSINNVINAISPAITGRYLNISENDFQILFYIVLQQRRKKY